LVTEILPLRKTERWVLAITIVVVIAYAWLIARGLEPDLKPPSSVVSEVVWLTKGHVTEATLNEIRHSEPAKILGREIYWMQSALDLIGPFRESPLLAIHLDSNDHYRVSDGKVELGLNLAKVQGQVLKALLKSWLYQRASTRVTSSLLRMEVVSDFLSALIRGQPWLENAFAGAVDEVPPTGNWLTFVSSYDSVRKGRFANAWISAELQRYSGHSSAMNILGFRPLLLAMMWELYRATPPLRRYDLVREWISTLTLNTPPVPVQLILPGDLGEWRKFLRGEFDTLMPAVSFARGIDGYSETRATILRKAGLAETGPLMVPIWLFRDKANVLVERVAESNTGVAVLEIGDKNLWLLSFEKSSGRQGWIKLSSRDRAQLHTQQFVWEGCHRVKISDLLGASASAEQILFVGGCGESGEDLYGTETGWRALLSGGLREFARTRSEVPFVMLKRSAVEVALRQGRISPDDGVENFLGSKLDPIFGLDTAQWSLDLHAYRVLGPIEAVQWIRSSALTDPM
jgi:hypothetical protein